MAVAAVPARIVERPLFSVDGVTYTWGDVVVAARLGGAWAAVEHAARRGLAALEELHRRGERLGPAEVQQAAADWRYARGLLAADELREWLRSWDLSVGEWSDWISQGIARHRLQGATEPAQVDPDEIEVAAALEAICAGAIAEWARELAARAALAADGQAAEPSVAAPDPPPARGLLALAPDEWRACVTRVAALALADPGLDGRLDAEEAEREIARHRLDWLRFEWRQLRLPRPEMAREAVCCLREDRCSPEDVAGRAGVPVERESRFLEDTDPDLQWRLLGVRPGEVVGPVPDGDAHLVLVVEGKHRPQPADPAVAARLRALARERMRRRAVDARVEWHERL